jgi:hypothetical protein
MGLFVMINQRIETRVFAPLLYQSPRIGATCFINSRLVGRHSIEFPYPVASNRCGNDGPVFL